MLCGKRNDGIKKSEGKYLLIFSGVDGSRTHVQKPIHCSSTIIVDSFGLPHIPLCAQQPTIVHTW